ncbi:GntR family transcriptional regulator [Nocardioides gansuensis]|uniref:GntR family transcriptional regulator n=1 Tax=Nocardioides gansuensis TaxID=2138300 RepID=A0A2T8FC80_9ACTN|nr:GntR family transcriptional regulator [Nocardioides gansuensis]PVG83306.1 GntR family transcriptional regulator [Nocardioides gansuensis]
MSRAATSPTEPRATRSGTDEAYDYLKRRILLCDLSPGEELREAALAESAGFGRTPVREALRRLVQEGFVEVRPRQGYRVSPITLASVHDVFELRLLLEPAAVEFATRRAPREAITALHDLAHAHYVHGDQESYERFLVDNRNLHVRIAESTGNQRLAHMLGNLLEEMQRLFFLSLDARDSSIEQMHEHHELYDAMLAGDVEKARRIVVDQIEQSRQRVIDALVTRVVGGTAPDALAHVAAGPRRR